MEKREKKKLGKEKISVFHAAALSRPAFLSVPVTVVLLVVMCVYAPALVCFSSVTCNTSAAAIAEDAKSKLMRRLWIPTKLFDADRSIHA